MKHAILIAALLVCTHASADEASKRAKIGKLVVVQGLEQMFQQQLDASKATTSEIGRKTFVSMTDPKAPPSEEQARMQPIFERFVADSGAIFTARELSDLWAGHYGKNLTEADIDKILAYYMSPIGQKDVKASQTAMGGFMAMFSEQYEKRSVKLLEKLKSDLDASANR